VTTIRVTTGDIKQTNDTTATLPTHIILTSQRVGDIMQDINIPLVNEKGKWLVNWSPGLIYSQLDDSSDPNYTRKVHLFGAIGKRGSILDRDGNALAKDDTVYDVGVVRGKITNESALLNALASKLDFSTDQVKAKYQNAGANDFTLIRSITPMLYGQVSNTISSVAGVEIHQRIARVYPYGADTAAATGYVQSVSPDDLKNDKSGYYDQSDVIGRAGVELWAEQQLRPVKGGSLQIAEQNADGTLGKAVDDQIFVRRMDRAAARAHGVDHGHPARGDVVAVADPAARLPGDRLAQRLAAVAHQSEQFQRRRGQRLRRTGDPAVEMDADLVILLDFMDQAVEHPAEAFGIVFARRADVEAQDGVVGHHVVGAAALDAGRIDRERGSLAGLEAQGEVGCGDDGVAAPSGVAPGMGGAPFH